MIVRSLLVSLSLVALTCAAQAQDAEAGKKVFNKCRACHQVGPTAKNGVGPELNGLIGRIRVHAQSWRGPDALVGREASEEAGLMEDIAAALELIAKAAA